jgi:hypothetical protein
MTAKERKTTQDEADRSKKDTKRRDDALDEALKETFPASDPVAPSEPGPKD